MAEVEREPLEQSKKFKCNVDKTKITARMTSYSK